MGAPKGNKYAKGHGYGAPEKYTDKMIEAEARALREWMEKPDSIFLKTFCVERGYHPNRLQEFSEKNNVFSGVLELAKVSQECKLVNYGLFNKVNCGMAKFILAVHHNYIEKSQVVAGDGVTQLGLIMTKIDGQSKELVDERSE